MFEIKEFSINDPNLEIIWKKLEDGSSPFIFQTFDWCKNWFDKVGTHNQQEKFIILVAFENNKPLVLFPFVLKSNRLFRKVEFFGGDQSDYNSPLYSTLNFSFSDLWKEVLKSLPAHDLMILKRIPEFIEVNKNPITSLTNIKVTGNAQYLNLDPDEIKENFISKRSKKDIERMIRRLSELGNLTEHYVETEKDFKEIIKKTISQKEKRYLDTGARNILSDPLISDFYKSLYNINSERIKIHLSYLKLDEEILATHLGFIFNKRFYYIFPTFDDGKYVKYSPGRVLLYRLVELCVNSDVNMFDLTIGSEGYKKKWSNGSMNICDYTSALTFKGRVLNIVISFLNYLKTSSKFRPYVLKINKFLRIY